MNTEEKNLLIKDLSARLPYRVKAKSQISHLEINTIDGYFVDGDGRKMFHLSEPDFWQTIDDFHYYLRPMSSMTEEEYNELEVLAYGCDCVLYTSCFLVRCNAKFNTYNLEVINWLNAHHFDYRGLIDKELALKAPEGMYKI